MNNLLKIAVFSTFCVFAACKHDNDLETKLPKCISNKIENLKEIPVQSPPAEVWEWKVDGKTYYYFTSNCCDEFNYLYDNQCNVVCAPNGGLTGGGDGACPTFTGTIEYTLVWKDPRK